MFANYSKNSRPKYKILLYYIIMHFIIHIILGRNFNKLVRITKVTTKLCKLKAVFFPLISCPFFLCWQNSHTTKKEILLDVLLFLISSHLKISFPEIQTNYKLKHCCCQCPFIKNIRQLV